MNSRGPLKTLQYLQEFHSKASCITYGREFQSGLTVRTYGTPFVTKMTCQDAKHDKNAYMRARCVQRAGLYIAAKA